MCSTSVEIYFRTSASKSYLWMQKYSYRDISQVRCLKAFWKIYEYEYKYFRRVLKFSLPPETFCWRHAGSELWTCSCCCYCCCCCWQLPVEGKRQKDLRGRRADCGDTHMIARANTINCLNNKLKNSINQINKYH